ncbi:MAG TPA: PIN domain-containing protein [Ilumatobacter sp.]|nr:PIN domain-containing protein [Ilumatobacter sp.]
MTANLCLDTGALIAIERGDGRVRAAIDAARRDGHEVYVPAGAIAQAWRGGSGRQVELARFLKRGQHHEVDLDAGSARAVGELCSRVGVADVVDAHVALVARLHDARVVTSDPDDIARFPGIRIIGI